MGRHEIGEDGISYSVRRSIEQEELNLQTRLLIMRRKCFRFALRNSHHISAAVALHVVALFIVKHIPYVPH